MHWAGILLYSVIALWVLPGAFIHRTALVLLVAWLVGEGWYFATGEWTPTQLYVLTDAIAFGLIMSWRTSWADAAVLCIYPAMWVGYIANMDETARWWLLYFLAMAQFIIAGPWPAILRNRTEAGRRGGVSQPILTKEVL